MTKRDLVDYLLDFPDDTIIVYEEMSSNRRHPFGGIISHIDRDGKSTVELLMTKMVDNEFNG
jgi:hypothetical protein